MFGESDAVGAPCYMYHETKLVDGDVSGEIVT